MGNEKNHARIIGHSDGNKLELTAFFAEHFLEKIKPGMKIDAAFTVSENFWKGKKRLQLRIVDMRKTNSL